MGQVASEWGDIPVAHWVTKPALLFLPSGETTQVTLLIWRRNPIRLTELRTRPGQGSRTKKLLFQGTGKVLSLLLPLMPSLVSLMY